MKKIVVFVLFFGMMSTFSIVSAEKIAVEAEGLIAEKAVEGTVGWKKAGNEIGKAAQSVGDATVDTSKKAWKATRDSSAEVWDKTKDGSKKPGTKLKRSQPRLGILRKKRVNNFGKKVNKKYMMPQRLSLLGLKGIDHPPGIRII